MKWAPEAPQPRKYVKSNKRKYERYRALSADLQEVGFLCKNSPFEVGSRGHLSLGNKSKLIEVNTRDTVLSQLIFKKLAFFARTFHLKWATGGISS